MVEKSINLATEEYVNNTVAGLSNRIDILTELVDVPPVYTKPSLSLSLSTTITKHNEETTVVITPNYTQNDAGEITEFILKKDGVELVSSSSFIQRYTDTITLKHGESAVYSATVSYADGPIKNTTLGFPYPSTSIKAGIVEGSNVVKAYGDTIVGVVDTNESGEDSITTVNTFLNPKKEYTNIFSLVDQRIVYMYPSSYGELKSIKDANNFEYINSYSKSVSIYDEIEYFIYILIDPVTITEFKQVFS
jgi:hypothetical protein